MICYGWAAGASIHLNHRYPRDPLAGGPGYGMHPSVDVQPHHSFTPLFARWCLPLPLLLLLYRYMYCYCWAVLHARV